jgi:hypothetical protein
METIIVICLWAAAVYLLAGFVFAVFFIVKGITVVDSEAKASGIGFRLIILPGAIILWPLLLKKWIKALHP